MTFIIVFQIEVTVDPNLEHLVLATPLARLNEKSLQYRWCGILYRSFAAYSPLLRLDPRFYFDNLDFGTLLVVLDLVDLGNFHLTVVQILLSA